MARENLHPTGNKISKYGISPKEESQKINAKRYMFSKDDMMVKFMLDESFRKLISTAAYIYLEDRIVLYNPDVFQIEDGNIILTLKSDTEYEQYCISEKNPRVYSRDKDSSYGRRHFRFLRTKVKGRVRRGKTYKQKFPDDYRQSTSTDSIKEQREIIHAKDYTEEFEREYGLAVEKAFLGVKEYIEHGECKESDFSFGKLFSKYMDDRGISTNDLADLTGIDPRTIRRLKKDDDYYGSLDYVVMCCLAMGLSPHESDALLYLGSHVLRKNNKKERAYDTLLHVFYWCESMFDYDLLLCKMELETFTELIEKEREKHKNK